MMEHLLDSFEERQHGHLSSCYSTMFSGSFRSQPSLPSAQKRDACTQTDICELNVFNSAWREYDPQFWYSFGELASRKIYYLSSFDAMEMLRSGGWENLRIVKPELCLFFYHCRLMIVVKYVSFHDKILLKLNKDNRPPLKITCGQMRCCECGRTRFRRVNRRNPSCSVSPLF